MEAYHCFVGPFSTPLANSGSTGLSHFHGLLVHVSTGLIAGCLGTCEIQDCNHSDWNVVESDVLREARQLINSESVVITARRVVLDSTRIRSPLSTLLCVPAFHDAHIHALSAGIRMLSGCDLSDYAAWMDARVVLSKYVKQELAIGKLWIIAGGWRRSWFEAGYPSCSFLDDILPAGCDSEARVYIREADGHSVWLNSRGLQDLRVANAASVPEWETRGYLSGGVVMEAAGDAAAKMLPKLSLDSRMDAINFIQDKLLESGIVGYQEAGLSPENLIAYAAMYSSDDRVNPLLLVRALATARPGEGSEAVRQLKDAQQVQCRENSLLQINGVKLFLDGLLEDGTAALLQPDNMTGEMVPTLWTADALEALALELQNDNCSTPLHVHTIGDGAFRLARETFEKATFPLLQDLALAHVQLAGTDDLKCIGVLRNSRGAPPAHCVLSPLWFKEDAETEKLIMKRLGPDRFDQQYPWRQIVATEGLRLCFGSDFPVTGFEPCKVLLAAIRAEVPFALAVRAMTLNAAEACGFMQCSGSLEVGKRADFVLLEVPFEVAQSPSRAFGNNGPTGWKFCLHSVYVNGKAYVPPPPPIFGSSTAAGRRSVIKPFGHRFCGHSSCWAVR